MRLLFDRAEVFLQAHTWLLQLLPILGMAAFFTYTCYLFYQRIHPNLVRKRYFITSALLKAISWPSVVFIWVRAVASVINVFSSKIDDTLISLMWRLHDIGLILLLAWMFVRFIRLFEEQLLLGHLAKKRPDATTVQATGKFLRVGAVVIVILFILPLLGLNISGIVAFGGGSALVLGIGAQQIFADYFGGLVIYADRNFKVGDWIYAPDKNIEGQVEYIGWRATQIRTFDQKTCYVPNAILAFSIVVNSSRMRNRCIKEEIGIRHTDVAVLNQVTQEIRTMLQAHTGIDQRRILLAHFTAFGPTSLKISIYAFTKTIDRKTYHDVQQDVFLKVIQIIEQNGAALAFPIVPSPALQN
ncbi:MAG: mechanosensitive ion channel family protein [Bacteroidota bacterium]